MLLLERARTHGDGGVHMIDSQEAQRTCDAMHTKGSVERTSTTLLVVGVLSTESRAAPRHSLAEAKGGDVGTEVDPTVQDLRRARYLRSKVLPPSQEMAVGPDQ